MKKIGTHTIGLLTVVLSLLAWPAVGQGAEEPDTTKTELSPGRRFMVDFALEEGERLLASKDLSKERKAEKNKMLNSTANP